MATLLHNINLWFAVPLLIRVKAASQHKFEMIPSIYEYIIYYVSISSTTRCVESMVYNHSSRIAGWLGDAHSPASPPPRAYRPLWGNPIKMFIFWKCKTLSSHFACFIVCSSFHLLPSFIFSFSANTFSYFSAFIPLHSPCLLFRFSFRLFWGSWYNDGNIFKQGTRM